LERNLIGDSILPLHFDENYGLEVRRLCLENFMWGNGGRSKASTMVFVNVFLFQCNLNVAEGKEFD
jgi:hypothetical protein